ncbi:phage tail tube protein [Halobacterium sp. BOL4-2]|uniref:phage tail tube protein n=1 Tax=Halobacterium sp. BOL4-2 TaxID=2810537 RepID=UPI00196424F1|nr:phage tail tube protein [Halobacterium sp. BOL4-2]QRY26360.1 hypothetical protein JRZ79_13290 [Halobacterium sp. BOL4-2]
MTGAGSGELLFAHEDSFAGSLVDADSDGTPDVFAVGRNPSIEELSIDNQLERLREGDSVWSQESVKTNFRGGLNITATVSNDVHKEIEKLVFNAGGTAMQPGLTSSARFFAGAQYPSGEALEAYRGVIPVEYSIEYSQGEMVTYSLDLLYADQEPTSTDLSGATRVSSGTSVPFHGVDLTVDGASVVDLQSATLTISDIGRFQYGASPTANRGVVANPQASLDVEAILTRPDLLDLARGAADSSPPDTLDSVTGSLALSAGGTTVSTYNLASLTPDSHSWNNLLATDDTTDQVQFHVNGVTIS